MGKRLTYEFVKEQFEREGYGLLSKEYIDSKTKLKYKCPKGHEHSIIWGNWKSGKRCPYCTRNAKLTIKLVRSKFAKEKYKLLTTEYVNCFQKLEYICPKGHKHNVSWNNWRQGNRCPYCAGKAKKTIEFVRSKFAKEDYILLTTEYKNNEQKLSYICPKKHKHSVTWGNWSQNERCPYCSNKAKKTIEFIRSEFAKEGYKLLTTEYENCNQKLKYICPKGHKHSISWSEWNSLGNRCPYCYGNISEGEMQVRNFIKSLGIEVLSNNRNQIFNPETENGLELDIFMPTFNKAVEYNGEYWHQDETRDLLKQQLCKLKGIDLLTIWDKEWKTDKNVCKSKIKKFVFNKEEVFK
jgi:hypothetical protein